MKVIGVGVMIVMIEEWSSLLTVTVSVTVTVEAAAQPEVVGTAMTVVGTAGMMMTVTVLVGTAVTVVVV